MGMKKSNLAMLNMMSLAMSSSIYEDLFEDGKPPKRKSNPKPIIQPIPKGCKEYFFNINGVFYSPMRKDECIFKCFAINDKNAIKKFNKFKEQNKHLIY